MTALVVALVGLGLVLGGLAGFGVADYRRIRKANRDRAEHRRAVESRQVPRLADRNRTA